MRVLLLTRWHRVPWSSRGLRVFQQRWRATGPATEESGADRTPTPSKTEQISRRYPHEATAFFPVASALLAIAATAVPTTTFAQSATAPATKDWPYPTGNLGSQGYTALTQISKSNVKNLGPAWLTNLSAEPVTQPVPGPGGTATAQQTIPIVVDGVMYVNPPNGGVVALDAATGVVKWKWVPSTAAERLRPRRSAARRLGR